ncbi:hypothetical protein AVEN_164343-1, partial [Araneus ventricosus]
MLVERLSPRWSSNGLTPFLGRPGQCEYFCATPTVGRLATAYDLACSRPHTRRIFRGIGFRAWNPPGPNAEALPLGHRSLRKLGKCSDRDITQMNPKLQHQLDGHGTGRHDCKTGTEVNRKIASITSGSCDDPPFTGYDRLRRWTLRATLPLLYPTGKRGSAYLYGRFPYLRCPLKWEQTS